LKSLDSRDLVSLRQDAIHDLARQASDNAKRMTERRSVEGREREEEGKKTNPDLTA
jgi:hypothetical protein